MLISRTMGRRCRVSTVYVEMASEASASGVAITSGKLYYMEHGVRLGQDVRQFAPHGGQRDYVLGALQKVPPC